MPARYMDILPKILKKRVEALGYPTLRRFHSDRADLGVSYELLRQVVHNGRVPKVESLVAILRALRYPPPQIRKILDLCVPGSPETAGWLSASPDEGGSTPRSEGEEALSRPPRPPASPGPAGTGEEIPEIPVPPEPDEILGVLRRCLARIPRRGNEDFWEIARTLAALAERKVREAAAREAGQSLLFDREPEAVYQFLLRREKIPSYMARGEGLLLEFAEDIGYPDRYLGSLLGAAIGESLGRVTRGLSPRDVRELFGSVDPSAPPRPTAADGRPVHPPSVLAMARPLLREGIFSPPEVAEALAMGLAPEPGEAAAEFARNLVDRGLPWFEAGVPAPESAAAARIVPVALLRAGEYRRLKLEAGIAAAVTNPDPVAVTGAVAHAAAVARLLHLRPGELDVLGFARSLAHAVAGIEPDRAVRPRGGKTAATLWRRLGTELTALLLRRAEIEEVRETLGNGPAALEGIPFAWACFLRSPEDFAGAVLPAVNLGNDAPNVASLAGGLAGAYLGASAIPPALRAHAPNREEIGTAADRLLRLARGRGETPEGGEGAPPSAS